MTMQPIPVLGNLVLFLFTVFVLFCVWHMSYSWWVDKDAEWRDKLLKEPYTPPLAILLSLAAVMLTVAMIDWMWIVIRSILQLFGIDWLAR